MFWRATEGWCRAAVVLAPDPAPETGLLPQPLPRLLLDLGLLAVFDALAVLAPPQLPLAVRRPDQIVVDGGTAATVRATHGASLAWAVLGFDIAIEPGPASPGDTPDQTCLAEEGFGEIDPADLLAHVCRHLLGWVDAWQDEGAETLSRAVDERQAALRPATRTQARRTAA